MIRTSPITGLIFAFMVISSCHGQFTVAAAANLRFVMKDLRASFIHQGDFRMEAVFGSSGKLAMQIRNGAPFDIFLSADTQFANNSSIRNGVGTRMKIYAFGKLAIWTTREYVDLTRGPWTILDASVRQVAIGGIRTTAYGPATRELLRRLGLWKEAETKAIYGESVMFVAEYVLSGAADIGFAPQSLAMVPGNQKTSRWVSIDTSLYDPIPQAAVLIAKGNNRKAAAAAAFFDFLSSDEARDIFRLHGYEVPTPEAPCNCREGGCLPKEKNDHGDR
jgi:molybdate transport system substrate-binding protein